MVSFPRFVIPIISAQAAVHSDSAEDFSWTVWLFVLAQLFHGAGAAPLFTLGVTYIDENVSKKMSSIYLGKCLRRTSANWKSEPSAAVTSINSSESKQRKNETFPKQSKCHKFCENKKNPPVTVRKSHIHLINGLLILLVLQRKMIRNGGWVTYFCDSLARFIGTVHGVFSSTILLV